MSYEYGLLYTAANRYFSTSLFNSDLKPLTEGLSSFDYRDNLTTMQLQQESENGELCPKKKMDLSTRAALATLLSF